MKAQNEIQCPVLGESLAAARKPVFSDIGTTDIDASAAARMGQKKHMRKAFFFNEQTQLIIPCLSITTATS
jgi:hypothetical protein